MSAQAFVHRVGIKFAVVASLEIFWGLGGLTLRPALQLKRSFTKGSIAFRIVDDWCANKSTTPETVKGLEDAFKGGNALATDIDETRPGPLTTLLGTCIIRGFGRIHFGPREELQVLTTLLDHGAVLEWSDLFAMFNDFHDDPMETFLRLDPEIDFPEPVMSRIAIDRCFGAWSGADPFLLDWFHKWTKLLPGFADVPQWLQTILFGAEEEVHSLSEKGEIVPTAKFLGRSVLHWAARDPQKTESLLRIGCEVDALDDHGLTPLIFAAAYGNEQTVLKLLENGADFNALAFPVGNCKNRVGLCNTVANFLNVAFYLDHNDVARASIRYLQLIHGVNPVEVPAPYARVIHEESGPPPTRRLMRRAAVPTESGEEYEAFLTSTLCNVVESTGGFNIPAALNWCVRLLQLGADPNVVRPERLVGSSIMTKLFLDHGYRRSDSADYLGATMLMKAAILYDEQQVDLLLQKGADVSHTDNLGQTAMHYALDSPNSINLKFKCSCPTCGEIHLHYEQDKVCSFLRRLFVAGASPTAHDSCRCACSNSGCTPSTNIGVLFEKSELVYRYQSRNEDLFGNIMFPVEWLLIIDEFRGPSVTYNAAVDLIRAVLFNLRELTHVCCLQMADKRASVYSAHLRKPGNGSSRIHGRQLDKEEIEEILEEEQDLIVQFEEELELALMQCNKLTSVEVCVKVLMETLFEFAVHEPTQSREHWYECLLWDIRLYWDWAKSFYRFADSFELKEDDYMRLRRRQGTISRCLRSFEERAANDENLANLLNTYFAWFIEEMHSTDPLPFGGIATVPLCSPEFAIPFGERASIFAHPRFAESIFMGPEISRSVK